MNIKDITKNKTNEKGLRKNSKSLNIIKGSIISIVITLIGLIIFSIILANTNISENIMLPVVTSIAAISILVGSIISISKIEKKGILNGALVGLIYILVIYILSSIVNGKFEININSIILIVTSIIAGMLGGVIGVNIKNKK